MGCLPYFHTWCGLSANLGCRSETCCTRLAENTGRKKVAKNRHLGTIAQLCRAISSQLRHLSTVRKQLVKQQYLLHMSSQYGGLRPSNGWDRLTSSGHPCKFQLVTAQHLHRVQKKNGTTIFLSLTLPTDNRFLKFFADRLVSKFLKKKC